jgi:hypothetical protein
MLSCIFFVVTIPSLNPFPAIYSQKKQMKKALATLAFILMSITVFSQTTIYSDNMESTGWTWKGVPKILLNSFYTGGNSAPSDFPANSLRYTSTDSSFALFGTGLGSSSIEKDTLSYANVTGLNPSVYYQIRFRVCSIGVNPSGNAAAGVDGGDYVQLEYSSNGGTTFFKELKFVGISNSMWGFTGGIQTTKIANGTLGTFPYTPGSSTTTLALNLPVGITQLSFNIIMAANATGETWFVDDVELVAVTALPVELVSFSAQRKNMTNILKWSTASETNNDYFSIYSSADANSFELIGRAAGSGSSNFWNNYSFNDNRRLYGIVYYRLCQTDFDGASECFGPIAVDCGNAKIKIISKVTNLLGQEVDDDFIGCRIIIYEDGSAERTLR